MVKTLLLYCRVQSLAEELRSSVLCGTAKEEKKRKKFGEKRDKDLDL